MTTTVGYSWQGTRVDQWIMNVDEAIRAYENKKIDFRTLSDALLRYKQDIEHVLPENFER